ncbi:MAG: O-antigen ligase family protein [Bacteroidota bacterium]
MESVNQNTGVYNSNPSGITYYPTSERLLVLAICASIAFPMVDSLVNNYFQAAFWDSFFTKGPYFCIILGATYFAFQRFRSTMIAIPLLVFALWLFSYSLFPNNRAALVGETIVPLATESFPIFIITLAVQDYRRLYKSLRIAAIIVIICATISILLQYGGQFEILYMVFSYSMSSSVLLMAIFSIQNKKKLDIFLTVLGVIIVFISGARGALIGIIGGFVFYLLINFNFSIKKVFLMTLFIIFIIYLSANYLILIQYLNDYLLDKNITSRTIQLILREEMSNSGGRDVLFNKSWIAINDSFFIGNGMAGDRNILGVYTHNLFTELLLEYGFILGSVFIITLVIYLLKALFVKIKDEQYYIFIALFFTTGFLKLQFSFSYLMEPTFFMMLALAITLTNKNRNFSNQINI